jgi:hypothetical protein
LIFAIRKYDSDVENIKEQDPVQADSGPVVPTFEKKIDVDSGKNPTHSKMTKI